MRILVLAGGIGGARFLLGVRSYARRVGADVTAVVNVGDDITIHGLRVCPDLDSVMYTLGDGADPERGWGRRDETWTIREELAAYGAEPSWFGLGDRDVATHLVRTRMLADGYPLSEVTDELCRRWRPGVRLLPASDDRSETHVMVDAAGLGDDAGTIHFQEWWIRHRAALPARGFVFSGFSGALPDPVPDGPSGTGPGAMPGAGPGAGPGWRAARPAAGVLDAVASADVILVAPSNPVVSITPILAIGGIREALAAAAAPIIGVSPVIAGSAVRGMAGQCLAAIGVECSAEGVGRFYGSRTAPVHAPGALVPTPAGGQYPTGLLDGWLVDTSDAATIVPAVAVTACPLWMSSETATESMVESALELARGRERTRG